VPRLPKLGFAQHIRLRVSNGAPSLDFATNDADVVIQWSDNPTPGLLIEPLMASARYPVISPKLCARENVRCPKDLLRLTLFYDETDDAWPQWFAEANLSGVDLPPGPTYPNCELSTTMVEQHQGVSLAYAAIVRDTIASGRLQRLFDVTTRPMSIYSIACPEEQANDARIAAFRHWLLAEAQAEEVMPKNMSRAAE